MGWLIFLCMVLFGFGLWSAISPETVFWKLTAWQYRNPEAVEPSDISYAFARLSGVAMCVIAVVGGLSLLAIDDDSSDGSSPTGTTVDEPTVDEQILAAEDLAARFDEAVRAFAGDAARVRRTFIEGAADELALEVEFRDDYRESRVITVRDPAAPDGPGPISVVACVRFPANLAEASFTGFGPGTCNIF
jgi:hypothetical protein